MSARVVAVAGRRVDAPDSLVRRFPADRVEAVRARLGDRLSTLARGGARTLVASAACGADLLALEGADRLGFRLRVVLPFEPAQFRSVSVVDRPGDWRSRFDRLVEQVGRRRDLVVLGSRPDDDGAFLATSDAILQEALALARDPAGPPRPDLVSVTAAFRARAVELRCPGRRPANVGEPNKGKLDDQSAFQPTPTTFSSADGCDSRAVGEPPTKIARGPPELKESSNALDHSCLRRADVVGSTSQR